MKSTGLKLTFAAAALAAAAGPALAEDAAPDWGTVSAYVAVQSDYRYRGISQNDTLVTPEGSINWSGPMGFYAGTWLAKTNWTGVAFAPAMGANPTFEMDLYGGKHFDLDGTDLNVEAYYYSYPDANKAMLGATASYFEGIFQLTHSFDALTLTATGAISPEWALHTGTAGYVSGTGTYKINDWLSIGGTVGHQWVDAAPTDYTHWDFGATATWRSWVLDVRYVGNDIKAGDCSFWISTGNKSCNDTVMATLTYNISDLFK